MFHASGEATKGFVKIAQACMNEAQTIDMTRSRFGRHAPKISIPILPYNFYAATL